MADPLTTLPFSVCPSGTNISLRGVVHFRGDALFLAVLGLNPSPSVATPPLCRLKISLRVFYPCAHVMRPLSSCAFNEHFSSRIDVSSLLGLVVQVSTLIIGEE